MVCSFPEEGTTCTNDIRECSLGGKLTSSKFSHTVAVLSHIVTTLSYYASTNNSISIIVFLNITNRWTAIEKKILQQGSNINHTIIIIMMIYHEKKYSVVFVSVGKLINM